MPDTASALPTPAAHPGLPALLRFDAATCAGMGAALLAAASPLAALLGLPEALLTPAGVLLLGCAIPMLLASWQQPPAAWLVLFIVVGNLAWVLASGYVAFAIPGITALGRAFVIAQALAVLALAGLEWRGLGLPGR